MCMYECIYVYTSLLACLSTFVCVFLYGGGARVWRGYVSVCASEGGLVGMGAERVR